MARNRMLSPEFWLDEEVAKLSPHARLLYMGLWNICDDNYATLPNRPMWIRAQVFPYEEVNTQLLLDELSTSGKVILFQGSDEHEYWYIKNFFKYQKIDRPSKPKYAEYKPELEIKIKHSTSIRRALVPEVKGSKVKLKEDKLSCAQDAQDIVEVIKEFEIVNPSIEKMFGNKTQRASVKRMLEKYGKEKVLGMIKYLPVINGDKYARGKSITPLQLEDNLGLIVSHFNQNKTNKSNFVQL